MKTWLAANNQKVQSMNEAIENQILVGKKIIFFVCLSKKKPQDIASMDENI